MLAQRLRAIRQAKCLPTAEAAAQLQGWRALECGSLQKEFLFADFHHASNFLLRYTNYCNKVNMAPAWANVYNRVTVTLANPEFGGVTQKELNAGHHLDMVAEQSLVDAAEWDTLSMEEVIARARIEHNTRVNDISKPTQIAEDCTHVQSKNLLALQ